MRTYTPNARRHNVIRMSWTIIRRPTPEEQLPPEPPEAAEVAEQSAAGMTARPWQTRTMRRGASN